MTLHLILMDKFNSFKHYCPILPLLIQRFIKIIYVFENNVYPV